MEEVLKNTTINKNNKLTLSTSNYENIKFTEDKQNKTEDNKEMNEKTPNKAEEDNLNDKVINEEKNEEQIDNNNIEENNNKEQANNQEQNNDNNVEQKNNNEENKKIEENNNLNNNANINNDTNQEIKNRHDYSLETRAEDFNKMNSVNNSHLMNKKTIFNNVNNINNSLEEQINNIKEIIEEKEEDKQGKEGEKTVQIESGLFEKSSVPTRVFNILKVKSELSALKHKLINIQQRIKTKEEEIEELKSRAKMKNIIFQKKTLDSKMITLNLIKWKNKEIEEVSLPTKNLLNENLKKDLKYYNEINKNYNVGNKDAEEDYLKKKNEFEEKSKNYNNLEAKQNNLKYKYNSLQLNDLKRKVYLENMKSKIGQIDDIKNVIENDKEMIEEKKKEIEEAKKNLEKKIDEYNKTRENKENKYQEMNKLQREINNKINKQKNEINKIRKEIKEIDKSINKEVENYHNLNKKDKESVNQMLINKNKPNFEFLYYIQELIQNENKKLEDEKKNRFKKLKIGKKVTHNIISKIKRKPSKIEEKISTENLPLLEEKLEYFLNNKGDKEDKK